MPKMLEKPWNSWLLNLNMTSENVVVFTLVHWLKPIWKSNAKEISGQLWKAGQILEGTVTKHPPTFV